MHKQLNLEVAMLALCNKGSICNLPFVWLFVWIGDKELVFCMFSYCCDKGYVQKQHEEEGYTFISFYSSQNPSLREVSTQTQTWRNAAYWLA